MKFKRWIETSFGQFNNNVFWSSAAGNGMLVGRVGGRNEFMIITRGNNYELYGMNEHDRFNNRFIMSSPDLETLQHHAGLLVGIMREAFDFVMSNNFRSSEAGSVAKSLNTEKNWEDTPILADAIEESGFQCPNLLAIFRSTSPDHLQLKQQLVHFISSFFNG